MTKLNARQLADVLRAEAASQDLLEGPRGVHVFAMRKDTTLYELGWVSAETALQDPHGARMMIERIKFASRATESKTNEGAIGYL